MEDDGRVGVVEVGGFRDQPDVFPAQLLDAEARDAVIADCFARAATAKQLADLHQAVREIADDRVRKVS